MKRERIPEERVAVLIGENGETKEEIQDLTGCEITIEGNLIKAEGEPLEEMDAQKVVKAIGRGFNPKKALKIVEKDVTLHIIDIKAYDDNKSRQKQLKGRIIGRDGETRRHIEKEANIDLSVYGTTVAIIGKAQNIEVAIEAINMLLNGSSHSTAYSYLERNRAKIKK